MARAPRPPRIHTCNVLLDAAGRTRVWSFTGLEARPAGVIEVAPDLPLPAKVVGKGWGQLARPRLNITWIADQPVFLQVIHLPTDDPREVPAMIELQMEKVSPLPVAQIVWAHEILPQRPPGGLSVLVLVAERAGVEAALGALEKRGFDADRVESPLLQLVAGTRFAADGAYIFGVPIGGRRDCLIGWVKDGALRCLNAVNLPEDEAAPRRLIDELNRMAWAGEVEGWSSGTPAVHLMADEIRAAAWKAPLEEALGAPVEVLSSPSERDLAEAGAARVAAGARRSSLLPGEFGARYRQQYTDRLWMGGLLVLFGAYLVGVLVYLGAVEVQKLRQNRLAGDLAQVNSAYTNTLRLKAQAQVLQETVNLRYAALDCWMATVESMPEELVLEKLAFSSGQQSLQIEGTAPVDRQERITEFWQALRRKVAGRTNLFGEVQLRPTQQRTVQGVPVIQWSFNCRLQRPEI